MKGVTDLESAKKLDERLATRGRDRASILAKAYERCAGELQEIDKTYRQPGASAKCKRSGKEFGRTNLIEHARKTGVSYVCLR
jgi:hypothetical protein